MSNGTESASRRSTRARFAGRAPAGPLRQVFWWTVFVLWLVITVRTLLPKVPVPARDPTIEDMVFCGGAAGSDFFIDRFEVTQADYLRYLEEDPRATLPATWIARAIPGGPADGDLPVTGVTYAQAEAYATFKGKRLPTVHEWEWAARGPIGTRFPWGEMRQPLNANTAELGIGRLTPVGFFLSGRSRFGAYDLLGNAKEWSATTGGVVFKDRHYVCGGSFRSLQHECTDVEWAPKPFWDVLKSPDAWSADLGFRCVMDSDVRTERSLIVSLVSKLGGRDPFEYYFVTRPAMERLREIGGPQVTRALARAERDVTNEGIRRRLMALREEIEGQS